MGLHACSERICSTTGGNNTCDMTAHFMQHNKCLVTTTLLYTMHHDSRPPFPMTRTLAEDKLFATLDPLTRRARLPGGQEVLLTDTVGFIQKLPTQLVAAFRATLEEIRDASVILHVIDASCLDRARAQARVVDATLDDLGVGSVPRVRAWNKVGVCGCVWVGGWVGVWGVGCGGICVIVYKLDGISNENAGSRVRQRHRHMNRPKKIASLSRRWTCAQRMQRPWPRNCAPRQTRASSSLRWRPEGCPSSWRCWAPGWARAWCRCTPCCPTPRWDCCAAIGCVS